MSEHESKLIPVASVSKADLMHVRPDLQAQIEALDERSLYALTHLVREALSPFYEAVLREVLWVQFGDESG